MAGRERAATARAARTEYQTLGSLKNRNGFSHSSKGWKLIQVPTHHPEGEKCFIGSAALTLRQLSAPCSSSLQALGRTKLRPS